MKTIRTLISALMFVAMAACTHQVPIPQGNIVTQTMVEQLRTGMTADEVRRLLGSPLIIPQQDDTQWVYFYDRDTRDTTNAHSRVDLVFDGDTLAAINTVGEFTNDWTETPIERD